MSPQQFLEQVRATPPGERIYIPGPLVTYVGPYDRAARDKLTL